MNDLNEPVLPGTAATDYERYLRTDELLSLQKSAGEMTHRDELLFQTVHQASELWLKLACFEVDAAVEALGADDVEFAVRLLRRATGALDIVHVNTRMLEHITPWDYHGVRISLGHGSGFDSPGFKRTHDVSPRLGEAFTALLQRRRLTIFDLYLHSRQHEAVFQLAERMLDWDEKLMLWRIIHLRVVERIIGGHVIGTQGTPVEVLGRRLDVRYYPELWDVRNTLTSAAHTSPQPPRGR
jgi:tryptophan 2,3-dioxygenase